MKTKLNMGSGSRPMAKPNNEWDDVDVRGSLNTSIVADIRKVPRENETYELILLQSVLEHFGKREYMDVLKEAFRLLKKKGKFIVSVPDLIGIAKRLIKSANIYGSVNLLYGEQNYLENYHKWGWSFESLKTDLEQVGFSNVKRLKIELYSDELRVEAIK